MKNACYGLLLAVWTGAGCVSLPSFFTDEKPAPLVTTPVAKPKRLPAPVTADQVNESNYREKLAALQAEIDRDVEGQTADEEQ